MIQLLLVGAFSVAVKSSRTIIFSFIWHCEAGCGGVSANVCPPLAPDKWNDISDLGHHLLDIPLSSRTATSWPTLMYLVYLRYDISMEFYLWEQQCFCGLFILIAIALQCNACACMWYFSSAPARVAAYLVVIISQSSCFHCMRQQQRTLHRPQSAQITTLISQEWKGFKKHEIVDNFHHFPLVYI